MATLGMGGGRALLRDWRFLRSRDGGGNGESGGAYGGDDQQGFLSDG